MERESNVVRGNMVSSLELGDKIRIGYEFETVVVSDDKDGGMRVYSRLRTVGSSALHVSLERWILMTIVIVVIPSPHLST